VEKQLIIIGGGAAGFFCAVNVARMNPALQVILLEKNNKLLSKVKISGGGRCNVTHACFDIVEMSRQYPRGQHFVKKAFHQFFTTDTIRWFEDRGVKLKTEKDGRIFPVTNQSQTIIDCLLKEAATYRVEIVLKSDVQKVQHENGMFTITMLNNQQLTAGNLLVACGGNLRSSMIEALQGLGHSIEEPVPSLFTFNLPGHPITQLMGVSVERAKVKIMGTRLEEEGPLLITHWGLSGPSVLRLSAWGARQLADMHWKFSVLVNWLPDFQEQSLREKFHMLRKENASLKVINKNSFGLPSRLWEFLAAQSGIKNEIRWADLSNTALNRFIKNLSAFECEVSGKTTFKEEFVTAGGIKLSEVDAQTMMSKKIPGLFFAGEVLDVDGITGGFNFQHAWTSGYIAAKAIAQRNANT
jgi:hypothetical protein